MKKFLVLGLILAVAGGAFAQSITFSGSIGTGFGIGIPDRNATLNDPFFTMQRDAFGDRPLEVNLNVVARNADSTAEVYFGLRAASNFTGDLQFRLENGNVRFNLLDNMVQLIVGRGGPGGFSTGAPRGQSFDVAEGGGGHVSVVFNATPELRFGLTIRPGYGTTATGPSRIVALKNLPISAGVRYAIPDVGSIHLNFRFNEGANIVAIANEAHPYANRIDLAIGANLAPLVSGTGLTRLAFSFAAIDLTKKRLVQGAIATVPNTGDAMDTMTLEFSEGITYVADALTLGADLRQTVNLITGASMQMNLHFNLFATYRVNDTITPGVNVGFVLGRAATGNYRRPADALAQAANGALMDAMGLALNPYVNINVGPSTTMQLGYNFARTLKGASLMTNAIYFNVGMSF